MGLVDVAQFLAKGAGPRSHDALSPRDRQYLTDVERIAKTLATQGGASAQDWPLFITPAESLIRLSRRWYE